MPSAIITAYIAFEKKMQRRQIDLRSIMGQFAREHHITYVELRTAILDNPEGFAA